MLTENCPTVAVYFYQPRVASNAIHWSKSSFFTLFGSQKNERRKNTKRIKIHIPAVRG